MAWARFSRDFDWPPRGPSHVAYKAGMRCNVPANCRREAIAAGAAEKIEAPSREDAEALKADPHWTAAKPFRDGEA